MGERQKPVAFRDLPAEDFPFVIEAVGHDDQILWKEVVEGACSLEVPGMPGQVKLVRITYPDGRVASSDD